MTTYTVRSTEYSVDESILRCLISSFDVWRDGLGKFSGTMGRQAFLQGTQHIVLRSIPEDRADPYVQQRYLKVLRHVLASRPRKS